MEYHDLHALIKNSKSSREYFTSLPVKTQCKLHEYSAYVHTAYELHRAAERIENCERIARLCHWR